MSQADALRSEIAASRAALRAAIAASGANWETAKGTADDGEAGWSPRQAAEHVIPSDLFFAGAICTACGYDGPANPLSSTEFATAEDAVAALDAAAAAFDSKINYVQDEELGKTAGGDEGMAAAPVALLMQGASWHLLDHAAQIRNPF